MDCVNHSGVTATAYCQNCGKALCTACTRQGAAGQIFCEPCWMGWQSAQHPFAAPPAGAPNPGLAAFLGLIPGVGAMYNGQFIKGLVHVFIFAVLVSAAHVYGVFGLFIAGWVFYQVFEAYHTAKARRDGEPLPDPLGLNDIGNWFGAGQRPHPGPGAPGAGAAGPGAGPGATQPGPGSYQAPYQAPSQTPWQTPYQAPYQAQYQGQAPYTPPQMPPVPPMRWRRPEPVGAIVLIALGVLFLMGQMDWLSGRMFEFSWPILLIGLGVWLIVSRLQHAHVTPPVNPAANEHGSAEGEQK